MTGAANTLENNKNIEPIRILLVEDNELNQKFATAVVKRLGFQLDLAVNGAMGVEKFLHAKYNLILMDIQMPEMNGIEATIAIRKIEAERGLNEHIPIIAVTAFAMENDKRNCMEAGMDEFLTKPYKPIELEQKIKKYIK